MLSRKKIAALAAAMMIGYAAGAIAQSAVIDNGQSSGRINLRVQPRKDAALIGQFYSGAQVEIIADAGGGWSQIQLGDGRGVMEAYVMTKFLNTGSSLGADETYDVCVASPYGTQSVVLRDQASNSYNAIAMLQVGEFVRVLGMSEDYLYVQTKDGSVGCLAVSETKMK